MAVKKSNKAELLQEISKLEQKIEELGSQEPGITKDSFLYKVIESLNHPIYVIDVSDYTIQMANTATRFKPEMKGVTCYSLFHRGDKPCEGEDHICPLRKVVETHQPVVTEHTHFNEDGQPGEVEVHAHPVFDDDNNVTHMIEYVIDITEKKSTENALHETVELLETILTSTHVLAAFLDTDFNFIEVNRAYADADEKDPGFFHGKNHFDLYPNAENEEIFTNVVNTGEPFMVHAKPFEYANNPERGITFWDWSLVPTKAKDGTVSGLVLSLINVTDRHKAVDALKTNEKKYRTLFETMLQGVVYQDSEGSIISANPAAEDILGLAIDQMQGRTSVDSRWKAIHEDGSDFPGETHPSMIALSSGKPVRDVVMGVFHPGKEEHRWILINATPQFREGEEKPYQVFTTFNDITELHNTRRALSASVGFTDLVLNVQKDTFFIFNPASGKAVKWNQAFNHISGYSDEEIAELKVPDSYCTPRDLQKAIAAAEKILAGEDYIFTMELITKDGRKIPFEFSGSMIPGENEGEYFIAATGRDITERLKAEGELKKSEEKFRTLFELSPSSTVYTDLEGNIRMCNQRFIELHATKGDIQEQIGRNVAEFFPPEEHEHLASRIKRTIETVKNLGLVEYSMLREDGTIFPAETDCTVLMDIDGSPIGLIAQAQDITERKAMESALKEREKLYSSIVESMTDGLAVLNKDFEITYWNRAMEDIRGVTREEVVNQKRVPWEIFPYMEEQGMDILMKRAMDGQYTGIEDARHQLQDGSEVFTSESYYPLRSPEGDVDGIIVLARDSSESKKAQDAVRESEAKFRTLFTEMLNGFALHEIILDEEGNPIDYRFLEVNPAFESLTGLKASDIIGRTVKEVLPGIEDDWIQNYGKVAITGEPVTFEGFNAQLEKHYNAHAFCPREGHFAVIFVDITERKLMEEALITSEEKYRELIEKAGIAIMIYQPEDEITFFNDKFADLFGYSVDGITSKSLNSLVHPDDWHGLSAFLSDRIKGAELTTRFEFRGISQDGTERTIECDLADMDKDGVVVGQRLYMWDITNRKMIEHELLRSHEQLRMLSAHIQAAREGERASIAQTIHDELGQNLTAMNMDISWIEKNLLPEQEAVKEKADGIAGLIYETLQRVKRLSAELRPGLLDDLGIVAAIEWHADEFHKASGIKCKMDVDQQIPKLDKDTSVIVFRVFQEIMTNVARHAKATQVKVVFRLVDNQLVLEISDNGRGIKDEEIGKQTSFGIVSIKERARLLGGSVSFEAKRGRGTTVRMLIPMVEEGYSG